MSRRQILPEKTAEAMGAAGAWLTREALALLDRLARRSASKPS
jgi:hypothetical protein